MSLVIDSCAPAGADQPEPHRDAVLVLLHAGGLVVEHDRVRAQALPHHIGQMQLQFAAVDGQLRPLVAGPPTSRFTEDLLSEPIEEDGLLGFDRDGGQTVHHIETAEHGGGMGQQVDPDPERAQFRGRFVDAAFHTGLV